VQVVQQLENQLANLAHCKIGAAGAVPLAAALSAQNSIVALDLRDNRLDGKVGGISLTPLVELVGQLLVNQQQSISLCCAPCTDAVGDAC
jgi:hypothetical protein